MTCLPLSVHREDILELGATMTSQYNNQTGAAAPQGAALLPSPTANDSRAFWSQGQSHLGGGATISQGVSQTQQQPSAFATVASSTGPAPQSSTTSHPTAGPTATAPFLKDFNLVAEAAKRAQMAVVMRDLEGINL